MIKKMKSRENGMEQKSEIRIKMMLKKRNLYKNIYERKKKINKTKMKRTTHTTPRYILNATTCNEI